jgi:cysteinyl-tRNA synthetase
MESEKMSKSLGNVALARDVVQRYPGEAVRYWAITGSYRSQVVFSDGSLNDAAAAYDRWVTFYSAAHHALGESFPKSPDVPRTVQSDAEAPARLRDFIAAMDDDFNSAEALAAVHEIVREGNKLLDGVQRGDEADAGSLAEVVGDFIEATSVLGFAFSSQQGGSELIAGLVTYLLELREQARAEKAFERADQIREKLVDLGVAVEDTPAGPRWRVGAASG